MKKLIITGSRIVALCIILLTLLALLLPYFDGTTALDDYMVHFMFGMIAVGFIGLFANDRIVMFSGLVCAAAFAMYLKNASSLMLKYPKSNDQISLNIAHVNLSFINREDEINSIVADETIDVISFQEFTPEWSFILQDLLKEAFPFIVQYPSVDPYGKAIFSKFRIQNESVLFLEDIPSIDCTIEKQGFVFKLFSVYLTPALNKISRVKASEQLDRLTEVIRTTSEGVIVIGELNQVYWSGEIMKFRNNSGLLNSRRDILPNRNKMPYDHIFHSGDLECYSFSEMEDSEGNHIGCKGKFQIKRKKNQPR